MASKHSFQISIDGMQDYNTIVNTLTQQIDTKKSMVNRFEDLKIGQHLWILSHEELMVVAKFDDNGYEVCGPWECGIGKDDCQIIQLIEIPKGYEKTSLYYGK